jgi:hypothetical protein
MPRICNHSHGIIDDARTQVTESYKRLTADDCYKTQQAAVILLLFILLITLEGVLPFEFNSGFI